MDVSKGREQDAEVFDLVRVRVFRGKIRGVYLDKLSVK